MKCDRENISLLIYTCNKFYYFRVKSQICPLTINKRAFGYCTSTVGENV